MKWGSGSGWHVGGKLFTLTLNAFALNVTRFVVRKVLASITRGVGISVPRTNRLVSVCTLNMYTNTFSLVLVRGCHPGGVLLFLASLIVLKTVVTAVTPDCKLLLYTHFVRKLPRNTCFNATAVITIGVTGRKGNAGTITVVYTNVPFTGLLNIPLNAFLDRAVS